MLRFKSQNFGNRSFLTIASLNKALLLSATVPLVSLMPFSTLAQQYSINLDRPEKVGDRYHLEASSTKLTTATATVSYQFLQKSEDGFTVELSADVTIEAAASNWATRKRFKVLNSKIVRSGVVRPLLPQGTVVVAFILEGKTIYQVEEKTVDEDISAALNTVIGLHTAGVGDNDLYGTMSLKRVGDKWVTGIEAMKKLLNEMGVQGGRHEISGESTLEKVEQNHLYIRSTMDVHNVLLPVGPDYTPEIGDITTEHFVRLPLSESDLTESVEYSFRMSRIGSAQQNGGKITLQIVLDSKMKYDIRPL